MPKIKYQDLVFQAKSKKVIDQANEIIEEYRLQGFDLTLRQLYYQFVSRDLLKNSQKEYKRLGSIINDARLAGLVDWDAITDRTRNLRSLGHWDSPKDIIDSCVRSYRIDKWEGQPYRPEVWIEKDALVGVLESVCPELDVPYFSCRGYTSQSEMWSAAGRLKAHARDGQQAIIFHLGDHDPSGLDMSRDIEERLKLFGAEVEFHRIALNMDQVEEYSPPPNPAKMTDSRIDAYFKKYGNESWELDALDPNTITDLIRKNIEEIRHERKWMEAEEQENEGRRLLTQVKVNWDKITKKL